MIFVKQKLYADKYNYFHIQTNRYFPNPNHHNMNKP